MGEAHDIITTIFDEPTTCSRCFAKAVTAKHRGAIGNTPCSDNCGSLSLSMESDPISSTAADRRVKNLIRRLDEHEISVDEDAVKAAVDKNHDAMPPEEMFAEALQYGLGNKDPSDLEPDTHEING